MFTTLLGSATGVSTSRAGDAGTALALILMSVLLGVVVLREIAAGASVGWLRQLARGTTIALVPLGLGFLLVVGTAIASSIGRVAQ